METIIYGILGMLFAGAQYFIPNRESKPSLIIRSVLLIIALVFTVMMGLSIYKIK